VVAHVTQRKQQGKPLPPLIARAEASSPKLINIDVVGAPRVVEVAQSPERFLSACIVKLRSRDIFFAGNADRKAVVQLLRDMDASIAVEVAALSPEDQKALAVPSDAATRDQQLTAEISAGAEVEIALRAAKRALAEKQLALDAKSEAVGPSMAKGLQYVLGIMILLTTVQLQRGTRSWCVRASSARTGSLLSIASK
jgi:hypothetical protein